MSLSNENNVPVINEYQFKAIFFEIDVIVFYNTEFYKSIERRLSSWDNKKSRLGDIFVILVSFLEISFSRKFLKNSSYFMLPKNNWALL